MKHLPTEAAATLAGEAKVQYLACEPEGKAMAVHLNLQVVEHLGFLVMEAFKSIPRRGLEVGGLLLGERRCEGDRTLVVVDDFEALPSEHRQGPSLLLSERDCGLLEQRLAEKRAEVVGFWRSHTRPDTLAPTPEDCGMMARHFPEATDVLLLIRPASGASSTAAFAWREAGSDPQLAWGEFPFQRGQLAAEGYRIVETEPPQAAAAVPAAAPAEERAAPGAAARARAAARRYEAAVQAARTAWERVGRLPVRRWLWAPVAALGLVAWAVFLWPEREARVPAPQPRIQPAGGLALRVLQQGDALRLEWDRKGLGTAGASGVLHISDGERQSRWALDGRQLAEGSVLYWPKGSDVNFRLEVSRSGQTASESVRVIGAAPRAAPAAVEARLSRDTESRRARRSPPAASRPAESSAAVIDEPAPRTKEHAEAPAQRPSPFGASPEQQAAAVPPRASEPPPPPPLDAQAKAPVPPGAGPEAHPPPEPFVTATAAPDRGSRIGRAVSRIPLLRRLRRERRDVVPARVVRRVLPAVPDRLRRGLREPLAVEVRAYVSDTGKVEYAEVLSDTSGPRRQFASLAVYAARQWQFTPAREGNRAVPDEMILRFRFGANEKDLRAGR